MNDFRNFLKNVFTSEKTVGLESIFLSNFKELDLNHFFIQEIAGRDSIASFYKYISDNPNKHKGVILSIAFAPTEFGNLDYLVNAIETAQTIAEKNKLEVVLSASKDIYLWKKLIGRNAFDHSKKYGFFTPCILCHLYFHILRAFIAIEVNATPIVSGERAFHGKKIKLNQTREATLTYKTIFSESGIEIIFPIIDVSSESELLALLPRSWEEGAEQLSCIFSGSSTIKAEKEFSSFERNYKKYLKEVVLPLGLEIITSYKKHRSY